ncbi:hypothetical protein RI367_000594 [Sorochytrium milnesiophthora]
MSGDADGSGGGSSSNSSNGHTVEQSEWFHILGQDKTSVEWLGYLGRHHGGVLSRDTKRFPGCIYYHYRPQGVSYCFDAVGGRDVLGAVQVDVQKYTGSVPLPYRLGQCTTGTHVVQTYGEPTKKGGGRYSNVVLAYEQLGPLKLQIELDSRTWASGEVPLRSVTMYK